MMPVGENRLKVASLRNNHPEWTLQQIADEVGISRERVRQLLVKLGLPTKSCLLYTSPSPRDGLLSRMPSSA